MRVGHEDDLTRDDWLFRDFALGDVHAAVRDGASHPADSVMAMPVFPAMLRDMLIRSPQTRFV